MAAAASASIVLLAATARHDRSSAHSCPCSGPAILFTLEQPSG